MWNLRHRPDSGCFVQLYKDVTIYYHELICFRSIIRNVVGCDFYLVFTLCCLSGSNCNLTYGSVAVCTLPLTMFECSSATVLYGNDRHRITDTTSAFRSTRYRNLNISEPSLPNSCESTTSCPLVSSADLPRTSNFVWVSFSSVYFVVAVIGIDCVLTFGAIAAACCVDSDVGETWEPGKGLASDVGDGDFFR